MTTKYKELPFTDNFMFSNTLYNNYDLCKELLELILNVPIDRIEMVDTEKSIKTGYNSHGVRFDVYVKDEANTHYDIDMQVAKEENLPKRSRYYHRMLDAHQLKKGDSYEKLAESYVIFICDEELHIEKDLPVYYYEYRCKDDSSITLNDGSHVVLVNCCYKENDISEELRNFFDYIKTGKPTGEESNFVHRLEQEVAINRLNEEWEAAYMTFEEIVQMKERTAREEGREEGIEQGKRALIMTLLESYEPAKVAEMLKLSVSQVQKIIEK